MSSARLERSQASLVCNLGWRLLNSLMKIGKNSRSLKIKRRKMSLSLMRKATQSMPQLNNHLLKRKVTVQRKPNSTQPTTSGPGQTHAQEICPNCSATSKAQTACLRRKRPAHSMTCQQRPYRRPSTSTAHACKPTVEASTSTNKSSFKNEREMTTAPPTYCEWEVAS